MSKPQLLSGVRGQVKVGGKALAYVTDCSIELSHSVRAVHTFGAANARSVEPIQVSPCTISLGRVVPVNSPSGSPVNSSMIAEGIEPTIQTMLTADDIEIDLFDSVTGLNYAQVKNCRFTGRSLSLSASQLAQERISLMGIYDAGSSATANKNSVTTGFSS